MFYQPRFCCKCDETLKSKLKRKLAGKCYKVSGYTLIKFAFTNIERCIFKKIHKNVIRFSMNAQKPLDNIRIPHDGQFIDFFDIITKFRFPIKIPAIFLCCLFTVTVRKPPYFSRKAIAGNSIPD